MKLLHVIDSIDPARGGPIECIRRMNPELRRLGHEVRVLTFGATPLQWRSAVEAPVDCLGEARGRYAWSPRLVPWLTQHGSRFDAVVVHGLWQFLGFGVRQALVPQGVPYVVFTHGMLDPWFRRAHPLKHAKKWAYWPWGEYRVLRDAAAVLFTCEEERRLARESFWLYSARERVVAFGTASPPPRAAAPRTEPLDAALLPRGRRYLLFLGRLNPKKGCDLLIDAYARVASHGDVDLVMAGPDDCGWRATLERRANEAGIGHRVHWTGMLEGGRKWAVLDGCEALVLPSHQENFGIVVAEALGCGKPVLVSERVNIWREIVADGAGLAARDDAAGTEALLQQWFALPGDARAAMAAAARRSFATRFTADAMAASVAEAVTQAIGGAPAAWHRPAA